MSGLEQGNEQQRASRWNVLMAILLSVNFLLVCFDLSYLSLRDRYLHAWPSLVATYDPIKGVAPHPDTQRYVRSVDRLATLLGTADADDLQATAVEQQLATLRQQSALLIAENPFLIADKRGAYTKLQQSVRQYLQLDSAQQALQQLWTSEYLQQAGWQNVLAFFDRDLRPLLAANFLPTLDGSGRRVSYFWKLDLGFVILFGCDFLVRTLAMARTAPELSWPEAMLRRWYDGLLLLPKWRWLRALPTIVRLSQARLLNLGRILGQLGRRLAG